MKSCALFFCTGTQTDADGPYLVFNQMSTLEKSLDRRPFRTINLLGDILLAPHHFGVLVPKFFHPPTRSGVLVTPFH